MNILHILPEFEEGGVERHVLALANGQAARGHTVYVVSAGGKLERLLKEPNPIHLPVHRKNLFTAFFSAFRIARRVKTEKIDLLHAHSRVPAWIAWWASCMSGVPWIATCHAYYSKNIGLTPYGRARKLLCVSDGVRRFFEGLFPDIPSTTIYNGLDAPVGEWIPSGGEMIRFLFIGRLTKKKGVDVLLEALGRLHDLSWTLDIVGDGPMMEVLRSDVYSMHIDHKVRFIGFHDTPDELMTTASCFLFPSLQEGMGLTLMRAVQMGLPVLSSDLPPVRELLLDPAEKQVPCLLPPGDVGAWEDALRRFIIYRRTGGAFDSRKIPNVEEMVEKVENAYFDVVKYS